MLNTKTRLLLTAVLMTCLSITLASAQVPGSGASLEALRQALEEGGVRQVQEKVYIHTDNQCYFVGDTLWYKAYVVRADDLRPTDMSRILYVELLSPDGLLVERQTIVVSPKGYTCGQFALTDSLYSGYYELRAYTRWQLNFNVGHHRYRKDEAWSFYNRQMAADYFRTWDGLYSRVLPVYGKPATEGDYDERRMYQRPKTRLPEKKKDDLVVTFYPEGGHLIEGVPCRVAFDITDQHGEAQTVRGTLDTGSGGQTIDIATEHQGRGTFTFTPSHHKARTTFTWKGKQWHATLPEAEPSGATMLLDGSRITITASGLASDKAYGLSILCGGRLKHFQQVAIDSPASGTPTSIDLPLASLPSGVADITLFDSDGQILADRLCFVNNHNYEADTITATIDRYHAYQPYEHVSVPVTLHGVTEPTTFSLAIFDTYTDEPTYADGNLMTDLLLSSELRGFVSHPAYYFEADDARHRRHLDLLMMVQGWRRYKWRELADANHNLRYAPERTLTVEGAVYKMPSITPVEPEEVASWVYGSGMTGRSTPEFEDQADNPWAETETDDIVGNSWDNDTPTIDITGTSDIVYGNIGDANADIGINHRTIRHEVTVEAEVTMPDGTTVGAAQRTQGGHYIFEIPPFYGMGYLNMKAYNEKDSLKKNMASRSDATTLNEDAFPDYYVKRDIFFPVYTHDYTFYEKHQPDIDFDIVTDTVSQWSMENDVYQLGNVNVKGHRRGRRAVDWNKPAYVADAYDLYNDITDRGLSFGKLDMRQFPVQVCKLLFGNMNRHVDFNVDGRLEGHTYYRNYSPFTTGSTAEQAGLFVANRTPQYVYQRLKLKRLDKIRVFSDFEPRTEDSTMVYSKYAADATVDLQLIPADGIQPTFRDRHILLRGVNEAEQFYQPDYSSQQPQPGADHRRTLYWNPNAVSDEQGRFTAEFFNNGKETRIRMTAATVTPDGRLMHSK